MHDAVETKEKVLYIHPTSHQREGYGADDLVPT